MCKYRHYVGVQDYAGGRGYTPQIQNSVDGMAVSKNILVYFYDFIIYTHNL